MPAGRPKKTPPAAAPAPAPAPAAEPEAVPVAAVEPPKKKRRGPAPKHDWRAIEIEYRAGQLAPKAIAALHQVPLRSLYIHARKEGWTRDLGPQVRRETQRLLIEETARTAAIKDEQARPVTEDEIAIMAARRAVEVIHSHRVQITRMQALTEQIRGRAEALLLTELNSLDRCETAARIMDAMSRAVERLQRAERVAFNIDGDQREVAPPNDRSVLEAELTRLGVWYVQPEPGTIIDVEAGSS